MALLTLSLACPGNTPVSSVSVCSSCWHPPEPTDTEWHLGAGAGGGAGSGSGPRVTIGERREMWETDQDPSAPLFVTWQLPQRRSHISHLNLYNNVKIKQYSVSGKSLMLHAFSRMETYGLSESWILKGITWLPFIFHLFASLSIKE